MRKQLFLTLLICTGYMHAAADDQPDQTKIAAIQIIGSAWTHFTESWKVPEFATAKARADEFSSRTCLTAKVIYAPDPCAAFKPALDMPAVACRPGLTGLKIGENRIECFVKNPTDIVNHDEFVMEPSDPSMGWGKRPLAELNKNKIFWPTIWHFLASEKGKIVVQECIRLRSLLN